MAEVSGSRLVSTDEGLDDIGANKIDELGNVFAMIAIAHAHGQVFVHGLADGKNLRGFRIDTDDTEGSRFGKRVHSPLQGLRGACAGIPVCAVWLALGRNLLDFAVKFFVFRAIVRRTFRRAIGIDAYRIDGTIHANAAG